MAVGLTLSDIVLSSQLAQTIYDRCFTKANGADYKYLEFGREIKSLASSLKTLKSVISNADKQNKLPRRPWHSDADRYGPAWNILPEVAGNFKHTLEECDTFLRDRSKFQYSQEEFVENVVWWSSVEEDIDTLQERVRFHMMKLTFVTKPFEIQLLSEVKRELRLLGLNSQELQTVLVDSLPNADSCPPAYLQSLEVPAELATRFFLALQNNKPVSMQNEVDIPLKEGFDALVYHFAKSTISFNFQPEIYQRDPEEPKYLNLIKCRWIVQMIKQSFLFQQAGADSLWVDYIRELEDDIQRQFRRFETGQLVYPPLERICLLPIDCFSIWVIKEPPKRLLHLAEQRPFEEKILELELPSNFGPRKSTLTIFRRSESKMRLVTMTTDQRNAYFHSEKEINVNMATHRLIPTYAMSSDASTMTNNVMLFSNEDQDPKWYSLKNTDQVLLFQRALTGFRVFNQLLDVTWSIEGSSKQIKSGRGRVQLWQLKPFQPIGEGGERLSSDASSLSSPQSPNTSAGRSIKSNGLSNSMTLFSSGNASSIVRGPQGDGTVFLRTEPPKIVILSQSAGIYILLQFKLEESIFINHKKTKSPTTVVIDTKSKNIKFHRICVTELSSWDLSLFRFPVHPETQALEKSGKGTEETNKALEVISKAYIVLTFPTTQAKELFCEEFRSLEKLRDVHRTAYNKALVAERHMANNPSSPSLLQPSKYVRGSVSSLGSSSSQVSGAQVSRSMSFQSAVGIGELDGSSRPVPELADTEVSILPELSA